MNIFQCLVLTTNNKKRIISDDFCLYLSSLDSLQDYPGNTHNEFVNCMMPPLIMNGRGDTSSSNAAAGDGSTSSHFEVAMTQVMLSGGFYILSQDDVTDSGFVIEE